MSGNPYEAPDTGISPLPEEGVPLDQALLIRQAHIKHEASIRSIGILYYIGAALCLIGVAIGTWNMIHISSLRESVGADVALIAAETSRMIVSIVVSIALTIIPIIAAVGIRKLRPWGRVVSIILSAIGLIAFPIGTLINIYILYILIAPKASMIFSPLYKEVIALTPDVKYKTSKAVWIILGLFVLLVLIAFFSPSLS